MAEKGPVTKYEAAQTLKKSYKNVVFAFNSLLKKELIKKTRKMKEYKGRKFEMFWLTPKGIVEAYSLGVSKDALLKVVLEKAEEPEKKINHLKAFFEFLEILGPEKANTLIDFIDTQTLEPKSIPLNLTDMEEVIKILLVFNRYEPYRTMLSDMLSEFFDKCKALGLLNKHETKENEK
jgi:hypothetical protein